MRLLQCRGTRLSSYRCSPTFLRLNTPGHSDSFTGSQSRVLEKSFTTSSDTSFRPSKALSLSNRSTDSRPIPGRPPSTTSKMTSLPRTHTRGHAGHSHNHDNTYLTSTNKNDAGVRITRIGLWCNLAMAIAKTAGGYVFHSQSLMSDGIHSATDLASDILTLATVSWSIRPPTAMFPTGFGKVESLGSLGVSGMLLGGGLFMCFNSCELLYAHFLLDSHAAAEVLAHAHSHGHSHSHGESMPSLNAAWLAAGTVAIKEWLYRATMKVATERKSSVLASNAVHHRVDSLTGIVTILAILGANFVQNAAWLDPVGGLLISLLVIKAGWTNTISAVYELADKTIDREVRSNIQRVAEKSLGSLPNGSQVAIRDVQGIKSGQNYLVDLELAVPKQWSVEETSAVEESIRSMVGSKVRGVRRVKLRFVPNDDKDTTFLDEFISGDVSPRNSPEPEHVHDHESHAFDHETEHNVANGNVRKTK